MSLAEMNAIEVRNLQFSYRDYQSEQEAYGEPVFTGLSFKIKKGEHALILGNADSGKTTLCRLLIGAVPKYLGGKLDGDIHINGRNLVSEQPWDLVKDIVYVSQNSEDQLVSSTPEDEVAFPMEMMGISPDEMKRKVTLALQEFELTSRRNQSVLNLSGGEKKRLLLSVSRGIDPEVYLLDETFDELDESFKGGLSKWISKTDKTVMALCSRALEVYRGVFDRFFILENGELRECSEDEIFEYGRCSLPAFLPEQGSDVSISCSDVMIVKGEEENDEPAAGGTFSLNVPEFVLRRGEIVALTGPNGSGKSSFARALCGLDDVEKGSFSLEKRERLVNVGYLFQNPDFQIFLPKVKDELKYPHHSEAEVQSACELFSLDPDEVASLLSYPRRKRLQAAVYYLLDRPFYILDELESSMSYEDCHAMIALLRRRGAGILLITHDETVASWAMRRIRICDKVMEACDEH